VLALAALVRAPVYLVHLSTAGSLELVRAARARGQTVFAEVCTHHLVFDDGAYAGPDAERYLVVPPLRPRPDVEALWDAVQDGTLDAVGSDHAQERYRPGAPPGDFTSLPYGLRGVEERLPVVLAEGVRRGVGLPRLVELLCAAPARVFGLRGRKGEIVAGADADLVLWDRSAEWRGGEGPYAGLTVSGGLRLVLQRGTAPGTKTPEPLAGPT
jgi:dihydropyrimidinase